MIPFEYTFKISNDKEAFKEIIALDYNDEMERLKTKVNNYRQISIFFSIVTLLFFGLTTYDKGFSSYGLWGILVSFITWVICGSTIGELNDTKQLVDKKTEQLIERFNVHQKSEVTLHLECIEIKVNEKHYQTIFWNDIDYWTFHDLFLVIYTFDNEYFLFPRKAIDTPQYNLFLQMLKKILGENEIEYNYLEDSLTLDILPSE